MTTELKFKRWFLGRFEGWSESYEPRRGSGVGVPDVQLLVGGNLLPVELKIGEERIASIEEVRLYISGFEPAQVSWHDRFRRAGGKALVCVGSWSGSWWDCYQLTERANLSKWRAGFSASPNREYGRWDIWKG